MGSAWNQLEQMLTCPICLDKFKNPRLLPCQHSFCGDSCMDGLVDYARRQIKCPECRAEHRIPYQGVSSLPVNVTLIRFLELHSRITGDEPEPVPTFMEKCSVCGEKVEGVQRCAHCEKKACPECREAHVDILRREVNRINGQSKRCLTKMKDFQEQIDKAKERLKVNHNSVKREIQDSCRRLIDDLQAKQKRLIEDVDTFVEQENRTLEKLRVGAEQEYDVLSSNSRLAEEKIQVNKYQWNDAELWEMKEIYARAMEFIRLFDADLGDFNRKIRFIIIPEFDTMRKRICDLGELKFAESSNSLMANAFQYCNATGQVAIEICQAAAVQAAAQMANNQGSGGYSLAHSNSNTNMVGGSSAMQTGGSGFLELPSMQNALMRSQSDHRLASQLQQKLKQQQQMDSKGRYWTGRDTGRDRDYETDALRSRYAPPRSTVALGSSAAKDFASNDLTRDWPRPSDTDPDGPTFGSSIQFKSAFMRRKGQYTNNAAEDDDDLVSEASYGGSTSARNVRFSEQGDLMGASQGSRAAAIFDCRDIEHGPFSGVPKLEDSPTLHTRIHQMGAKAVVDKKQAEEESRRDKELVESARQAMSLAANKLARKASEDEIEKQKRSNKQPGQTSESDSINSVQNQSYGDGRANEIDSLQSQRQRSMTPTNETPPSRRYPSRNETSPANNEPVSQVTEQPAPSTTTNQSTVTSTPANSEPSATTSRKSLYSQAITEKSKRQLASAIQEATSYTRRRASSSIDASVDEPNGQIESSPKGTRTRRVLRSSSRTMSKQDSTEQLSDTGTIQRRVRRLNRSDSSQQQSIDQPSSSHSKNSMTGSVGQDESSSSLTADRTKSAESPRGRSPMLEHSATASVSTTATDQTSNTTDDEDDSGDKRRASSQASSYKRKSFGKGVHSSSDKDSDTDDRASVRENIKRDKNYKVQDDEDDSGSNGTEPGRGSNRTDRSEASSSKRLSREFLPNAVNKLLDRSAQIRRDSQEQMNRGDSPQRLYYSGSNSGPGSSYSSYSSATGSNIYGSSSGVPRSSRFAYQRSQPGRSNQTDEESTANSSNSVYTTASSQGSRKSSKDEEGSGYTPSALSRGRLSGNSTESTLASRRAGYSRQDSSGESSASPSSTGFQSRFLSRSRTSAALSSTTNDSNESATNDMIGRNSGTDSGSSYTNRNLSSRDRFLQSTNAVITGSQNNGSSSGSSNLYSRSGSSTGKFTNILAWRARLRAHFNLSKN